MNIDEPVMENSKDIIRDLLKRLPDDISLQQVAHEIEFIAAIRQGVAELDRGESVSIEEVEAEMASWLVR
jgi:predicted transcriptional regulator